MLHKHKRLASCRTEHKFINAVIFTVNCCPCDVVIYNLSCAVGCRTVHPGGSEIILQFIYSFHSIWRHLEWAALTTLGCTRSCKIILIFPAYHETIQS